MKLQTKNNKKMLSFALTICVLFSMIVAALPYATAATALDVSYLTLAPGSDATQLTFSWHTADKADNPVVRIWQQYSEAIEFTGTSSAAPSSLSTMYYNRVTVTGLETNTAYTYQLGDGNDNWSVEYTTKTGTPDSFSYIVFGDPQVSSQTYGNNWKNTLELALGVNSDVAFMASTGDNIDSNTRAQYDYFFTPQSIFSSLPLATCMGNHEGSGTAPHVFYNPPNTNGGADVVDYWYRYGDTLFMVWDSTTGNAAGMRNFLQNAIDANPDATWRILNFHYDVYGQGSSHALSDGKNYRDTYVPVIDEFGIDVVFNGHDHSYSRSYPMKWSGNSSTSNTLGMQPENLIDGKATDLTGTVYFSLNSASGQKYYSLVAQQPYTAVMHQNNRPMFSIVDMTASSFTCTTYQVNADNTLSIIDSYTIAKTINVPVSAVVALSGATDVVVGNDATYTVSVSDVSKLATVTLQFEVDGAYFSGKSFTGLNGFEVLGDVAWTRDSTGVWTGRVTLVNFNGGVSSAAGALDIFEMVLASNSNLLGTTDVRLVDAVLSGYDDADVAVYIDSLIANGLVQTSIGQYFSKYDVNRDGVVDQLDLTAAQLFFMAKEGDANWNAAKRADVNGDGRVDIEDLILILKNITW
ncbi:fibronectin type III domain-containing protein [Candidatus Bathycorpusculum sp.]|uniref:fibronectin type III domain-containing protein n=1 Tax=Candidatus Bathycorpusculum sp. TaxID=2994959 RepID=UPI0028276958|nr:fibronectin type III domain-containing protein [Candidatus Termitimicrobium sp.]MCL2685600.1 fibronectin type III domain-containing protein [Candidatus Termitimicrobium sp.]